MDPLHEFRRLSGVGNVRYEDRKRSAPELESIRLDAAGQLVVEEDEKVPLTQAAPALDATIKQIASLLHGWKFSFKKSSASGEWDWRAPDGRRVSLSGWHGKDAKYGLGAMLTTVWFSTTPTGTPEKFDPGSDFMVNKTSFVKIPKGKTTVMTKHDLDAYVKTLPSLVAKVREWVKGA